MAHLRRLTPLPLGHGLSVQGGHSHPPGTGGQELAVGGWTGECTYLPQLPIVYQLRPVSVDQGTEAEAILPAAQGKEEEE